MLLLCLNATAAAQDRTNNEIQHCQEMHQYIVYHAYKLLEREAPNMAKRIEPHLGGWSAGERPWQERSIMAGAWREDCEDVVYGYGGPIKQQSPPVEVSRKSGVFGEYYVQLEKSLKDNPGFREGLVTATHFWDPTAPNNWLFKEGIRLRGTLLLAALTTDNQSITIKPHANAWDKAQLLFRPNWNVAVRDKWWEEHGRYYYNDGTAELSLPQKLSDQQEIRMRYESLAHLYNTGECYLDIPGMNISTKFVLSKEQRDRFVWELLGRVCHLLADMSVPAHTHRDMHMGNFSISESTLSGSITITVRDDDSYESWIRPGFNAVWTGENIAGGLIDITGQSDPLHYLFRSTRERAASFASEDSDGHGQYRGMPRHVSDIPERYNETNIYDAEKTAMMRNIRDNTLPYVIRATATLLAYFAKQLDMPADFAVSVTGASGYDDFFHREDFHEPFPHYGTISGTRFRKQAGDPLSLRAHYPMHSVTDAKFEYWKCADEVLTELHQLDTHVDVNQKNIESRYRHAVRHITPLLQIVNDASQVLGNGYPLFRDPWQVDPSRTHDWGVHQPGEFSLYRPHESPETNGGIFINNYESKHGNFPHYSIRSSRIWDRSSLAHKWPAPAAGDYLFRHWEALGVELHPEPLDDLDPPHPAFPNPHEYDTKAVNFLHAGGIVNAHVKAHRTSIGARTPTSCNSQRKVARCASGRYHAVYESDGCIWHVSSSDMGATWSFDEPVSEHAQWAARPSIAINNERPYVAYITDGSIVVRRIEAGLWSTVYTAASGIPGDATPVIALLPDDTLALDRRDVACVAWEDRHALRFALLHGRDILVDGQVLTYGTQRATSVDQPRYASIAATVAPLTTGMRMQSFHFAWIENGVIYHAEVSADRSTSPLVIGGWRPGVGVCREVVHAQHAGTGISYPPKHAPSIAVTDLGTVHVAFDVQTWYALWPHSSPPGGYTNSFAVRVRTLDAMLNPTWNTSTTVVSASNPGLNLTSPSIGAKPALGAGRSTTIPSLRVTYNDKADATRVVRLDHAVTVVAHEDGVDANLTVRSPSIDGLLSVYSAPAPAPYGWHLLASRQSLGKTETRKLVRTRELHLSREGGFSVLGISGLRRVDLAGDEIDVDWDPDHALTLDEGPGIRSVPVRAGAGVSLRLSIERYAQNFVDAAAVFVLRVRDAISGELLRLLDVPDEAPAALGARTTRDIDLSAFGDRDVYLDVDALDVDESIALGVVDRYAPAGEHEAALAHTAPRENAFPELLHNHPNPFNPTTTIRFSLPVDARARLSVHDLLAREVAVLFDGEVAAGEHETRFDATGLPSGVYLYRLVAGGRTVTRSMHLLR